MFEQLTGSGLLLHHWDTDGICSARLLLEHLQMKNVVNKTPELGNYYLTTEELERYQHYDFMIIVDMAIPEDQVKVLARTTEVMIFDHHLQNIIPGILHHNPISQEKSNEEYPSASWIVNQYMRKDINLYALLGIVGDHEQRILKNTIFSPLISDFCNQYHLTFQDLLQMVYLLDSNYKVGDRTTVEKAPHLLLQHSDVRYILGNRTWKKNLTLLEKEITTYVQMPGEEKDGIMVKWIQTSYNIISTVTRRIAWEQKKDVVVVNTGFFKDKDQLYVRSTKNLQPLINQGRSKGLRCGGKTEVMGAVVPKERTEEFLQEILRFLQ